MPGCVAGKLSTNPLADRHRARPLQLTRPLGDQSAARDQSPRSWFIAIERITEFVHDIGADLPHAHDTPPQSCATCAPKELRSAIREMEMSCPADVGRSIALGAGLADPTSRGYADTVRRPRQRGPDPICWRGARKTVSPNQADRKDARPSVADHTTIANISGLPDMMRETRI